jgi:SNF2 family DNA or RNA helicase
VAGIQSTQRLILGDDVGLGKTVQSVAAIQLLHNTEELSRNDTLIISPKAVRSDWYKTIKTHTTLTPLIGDESDQECKYLDRKWNVLIVGHPTARIRVEQFLKIPWRMIVLDEGMFKNSDSKTFGALQQLTNKAQRVLILNATPMEISLGEVYSHIELIAPGLISFEDFKTRFCRVEKKYFRTKYKTLKFKEEIVGPKTIESLREIKDFMSKFYLKRTYSDVAVQLPEKVIKNIRVDLLPVQKKAYAEEVRKYQQKMIKGSELLYNLLRICDGKLNNWKDEPNPENVSAKGMALMNLVASLGNQQGIIYSTYLDPLLAVAKIVKSMGKRIGFFTGQNDATRDKHLEEFKAGQRDWMFFTKAAQRGVNAENCAHMIMLNQLFNSSARTQLEGRISRINSKHKNIFIYNFIAADTIEENVLDLLDVRETVSSYINEDGDGFKNLTDEQVNKILKNRKSLIEGLS